MRVSTSTGVLRLPLPTSCAAMGGGPRSCPGSLVRHNAFHARSRGHPVCRGALRARSLGERVRPDVVRVCSGALLAKATYVDWAVLMSRTWGLDVLICPKCHKRLRVMATINDPDAIRQILEHLKLPSKPPPRAAARSPSWEQQDLEFDVA